jgi:hypothetical protein
MFFGRHGVVKAALSSTRPSAPQGFETAGLFAGKKLLTIVASLSSI